MCPVFMWNHLRHVRPPKTVFLFQHTKIAAKVRPMTNDGDTFFLGGIEMAAKMVLHVTTAVRVGYIGDDLFFEVVPLGEYVVDGREIYALMNLLVKKWNRLEKM